MIQEIIQEIENGGNCVNLGRSLKGRKPHLYQWVIDQTPWIPEDAKYTERLYCLKHGITGPVMKDVGTVAKFINISEGYRKTDVKIRKELNSKIRAEKEADKAIEREAFTANRSNSLVTKYTTPGLTDKQTKSIDKFVRRNRTRNRKLYESDAVEGIDYVVCPVSNSRLSMIKSSYIEKVLLMTVADYDAMFPGIQKIANIRKENISKGLKKTDETTGLTKHQIAMNKAKESMLVIDESGLSGYQKKGQKTRETHMSKVDENGLNGYQRIAKDAIVKGNMTKVERGIIVDPTERDHYTRYKTFVWYVTNTLRDRLTKGYVTGLCGVDGAYHMDHRYSVTAGFRNGVSPLVIGHEANIEMITWEENIAKYTKCSLEIDNLLEECSVTKEQSDLEFKLIMEVIDEDIAASRPISSLDMLIRLKKKLDVA